MESQQNDNIPRSVCETFVKKQKNSKTLKINEMLCLFLWLSGIIGQEFLCYFTSASVADYTNGIKKRHGKVECWQNDNIPRPIGETSLKQENWTYGKNQRNATFIFITFRNHRPIILVQFHICQCRKIIRKSHQKRAPEVRMPAEWQVSETSLKQEKLKLRWNSPKCYIHICNFPESSADNFCVISHLKVSQNPKIPSKNGTGTCNANRMTTVWGQFAKHQAVY